ncbi:MAG: recombination protein O N-terminal domain-containing protein [Candidatus Pacebacteria bacterium]|nr:recombination protein O N-terminal domain-containing protein [Candidatus Paceibacterota bacterium]
MSHHIYQTKAFIIDSMDVGEANKLLTLFTADLGLLFVAAQGVRVMKSKLRPSIQDLSFSKVALVRGKEYWRLTSAEKLISLYDKRVPLYVRKFMTGILQFVKRLTAGEAKHEELFDMLSKLFTFCFENSKYFSDLIKTSPTSSPHRSNVLKSLTLITEFRVLESLGYGSDDKDFDEIRDIFVWKIELIEKLSLEESLEFRIKIEKHIKKALESSHL